MDATAEREMRITVWRLFFCQALMQATVVGQVAMSALIGHTLSADAGLATLPMAVQMTAVMLASIPAGILFARMGRRTGFMVGAVASILGSLLFALGVYWSSFFIYCCGSAFAGVGFGIAQHYRFAASEVATPEYRPRAISLVMTGGILSAVLGPELVKATRDVLPPFLFLGTYLCLACLPLICMTLLSFVTLPPPPARNAGGAPVREIMLRPAFITAAVTGMVAYGTMNLLMTSTPVEMMLCGFGIGASATVIQIHAIAMFGPGFFTGRLISRFGVRPVITAGAALKQMYDLFKAGGLTADERLPFAIGIITAGLVGYACIAWLLRYLQRATTIVFTVYRVLLGVIVLVLLAIR